MLSKVFSKLFIIPIRLYQLTLSPLLGQNCAYHPTCSNYAIQAINEWGIIKGSWLAVKRTIRCNPWWGSSGNDPVPLKKNKTIYYSDTIVPTYSISPFRPKLCLPSYLL